MKNHKVKIKHLSFSLIPFLFLITLTAPFLCRYNKTINSSENLENRKLAEEPELDINHLDPYPKNYENYYNDHFGLRNTYLEFNNY
ncbi:MAG: hypothetical protein U9R32_05895, partial [Bacteroidota bacterium]|nr:hypothetical protein [Bacteroidota bacterium]